MANSFTLPSDWSAAHIHKVAGNTDEVVIGRGIYRLRPQTGLRWITRGDVKVLQQLWDATDGHMTYAEWRDIPLADESS